MTDDSWDGRGPCGLLNDIRDAGIDARLTAGGQVQLRGPADVRARLARALQERRAELIRNLRYEADPCCREGPYRCDHVWCDLDGQWVNDTGCGASCHPRHEARNCIWGSGCWLRSHRIAAHRDGAA